MFDTARKVRVKMGHIQHQSTESAIAIGDSEGVKTVTERGE